MPIKSFDAVAAKYFLARNRSKLLSIPQYHILILAWSALVILYGETVLSLPIALSET
jgi:hypothetical protein